MKDSQYKQKNISGNISKLILITLSATIASTSIAETKDESSGTAYDWTADAHLSEEPANSVGTANTVNVYSGEAADLAVFLSGDATKFKDKHIGISLCLSW